MSFSREIEDDISNGVEAVSQAAFQGGVAEFLMELANRAAFIGLSIYRHIAKTSLYHNVENLGTVLEPRSTDERPDGAFKK